MKCHVMSYYVMEKYFFPLRVGKWENGKFFYFSHRVGNWKKKIFSLRVGKWEKK